MAYYQHLRRISPLIRIDEEKRCELTDSLNKKILETIIKVMDRVDLVILSDYDKGFLTQYLCKGLIAEAKTKKIKIFVDPKGGNILKYKGCFAITPNQKEWETITGEAYYSTDDLLKTGMNNTKLLDILEIYVTLGDKGSVVLTSDKANHISPIHTEVVEVSGAGDTYITYLALSRTAGFDSVVSAAIGNIAAGLRVSKPGTEVTTIKEINEWVLANNY
jgi:D-beta-D-heptose 7-phosphate kinase/D-beta-D-heptose 1-phosphate adenosyltransferase